MKIKFVYALPVCLALGLCGCKSSGDSAESSETATACEKCGDAECACEATDTPACEKCGTAECACEG